MFAFSDDTFVKNMFKTYIPGILIKKNLYVPMIAPRLDLDEAISYERPGVKPKTTKDMTTVTPVQDPTFILDKKLFKSNSMVQVRLLSAVDLDVDFKSR